MTLPKNVDDLFELSPMQHLMLLHAMAQEGHGVLLNEVQYDVHGPLDVDVFRAAWQDLIARHAALRTVFLWDGIPHPVQVVRSSVALDFTHIDLSARSPEQQALALAERRQASSRLPMPLGRAPLMRCALVTLGADRHRFLWTIHHLVIDRWSHAILFDDLRALYTARITGVDAALPPAPRFRDYVAWVGRQDPAAAERFWRAELDGFVAPSPLVRQAPVVAGAARVATQHTMARDLGGRLRHTAARWRATPGAVLQAGIALLLAERSGCDDVAFGLTVSGRPPELPDVASTVGSFVNNVPARVRLTDSTSIEALVREVHRAEGRRLPYVHVSPVQLLEWTSLPAGRPIFDTLVVLNHTTDLDIAWPDVTFTSDAGTLDASYPFVLAVGAEGDAFTLMLVHDATFTGAGAVLARLHDLLARIVAAEDATTVAELLPTPRPISTEATTSRGGASHPVGATAVEAPADEPLAEGLLRAWREVLGVPVGLDDDFFAVGGTSLQAAQLFVRIERLAGKALPLSTLFSAGSVRALLRTLDRPLPRSGSLVQLRSSGARPTLYAVPGIDGNVVSLSALARHLGPEQPFAAFESPGLDGREAPLATIEQIAERYVDELLAVESGAIHLVGICWGAAVAFEMAQRLHAHGRAPTRLALMDPAVLLRESTARAAGGDARFVRDRLELYWDEFRAGSWRDRSRLLADKARRAAQVLAGGDASERSQGERYQARVRDANTQAVTSYAPQQPYEGTTRLFLTAGRDLGGREDGRLEWLTLIAPVPAVEAIDGINSGDAISPARAGSFARSLQSWLGAATGGGS